MATRRQRTKIEINADDKTGRAFAGASKAAGKLGKAVAAVGIAAAAAAVGGMALLGKSSMDSIDSLAKMADRAGASTEALRAMQHAGELAGASTEQVNKLVTKMNQSIGMAVEGTGAAADAMDRLGLRMSDLIALPADQKFGVIADRLNDVDDIATKTALAMDIFGRQGADAMNLIAAGSEGIRQAAEDVEFLGVAVSRVDAAKIEMANDAWSRLGTAVEGIGNRIAISAAPMMKLLADLMTDSVANADWLKIAIDGLSDFVVDAVGAMADAWTTLKMVWAGLKLGFLLMSDFVLSGLADMDASISEFASKIPGLDFEPSAGLKEWADESAAAVAAVKDELITLLTEPMPSEAIAATWEAVRSEVERTAQVIADKNTSSLEVSAATIAALQTQETEADEKDEERRTKRIRAEETHAERILRIWESGAQGKADVMGGFFSDMAILQETNSKKLFEVGKAAAIAQTVIDTHRAAVGAYSSLASIPYIGPVLGAAAAAAAIAYGFARVSQIRAQTFGGGAGAAGGGGGGGVSAGGGAAPQTAAAIPPAPVEAQQRAGPQIVNFTLENDSVLSGDYLRNQFIPALNDVIGDGIILKVS